MCIWICAFVVFGSCFREKAKMAWRHRSKDEKILIRVIGFLVFALMCFIAAVVIMDLTFKAKIQKLEDEIDDLKNTTPPPFTTTTTASTDTTDTTDEPVDTTTTTTTTSVDTTTTEPDDTTTTEPTDTTIITTTTTITPNKSTKPNTGESHIVRSAAQKKRTNSPPGRLLEALESLLYDFSGHTSSSKNVEIISEGQGVLRRTHGRFVIMADVQHEESQPTQSTSHPSQNIDSLEDSTLDIDSTTVAPVGQEVDILESTTDQSPAPETGETDDEDLDAEYSGDSSTQDNPKAT
nr:uncharacterized protein LOC128706525 isoform X1 [Cherax quadricarinatus]